MGGLLDLFESGCLVLFVLCQLISLLLWPCSNKQVCSNCCCWLASLGDLQLFVCCLYFVAGFPACSQ